MDFYQPYPSGGKFASFTIYVNQRTLDSFSAAQGISKSKLYTGTMAHELGHALGLADDPCTNADSLMRHDRDRNTITAPQTFDVDAVKNILGLASFQSAMPIMNDYDPEENPNTDFEITTDGKDVYIHSDYPEYENIDDLYENADLVLICEKITDDFAMMSVGENDDTKIPYTISELQLIDVLKGDASLERITIKQLGGTFGNTRFISENTEQLNFGERYLLFLKTYDNSPASLLNPVQGLYYVNGSELIARSGNNIEADLTVLSAM